MSSCRRAVALAGVVLALLARFARAQEVPSPRPPAGGLRETLEENDRVLGLGLGGPIASATSGMLEGAIARGTAILLVRADPAGRILAAQVVRASIDDARWKELAQSLVGLDTNKRLRVPASARGVWVTLEAQAEVRLPSGNPPGHPIHPWENGGSFDVTDLVGRAQRTVSTRIVREGWY